MIIPSVSYTELAVATYKNKSKLSKGKGLRSKAAAVMIEEYNSVLAALTE